ncbi:MAG: tetratricopeptide repeat protein [Puniceicoccales bacterium]|nr:tetratricopeptide repeat protein [Puniceicoccales bacterium]
MPAPLRLAPLLAALLLICAAVDLCAQKRPLPELDAPPPAPAAAEPAPRNTFAAADEALATGLYGLAGGLYEKLAATHPALRERALLGHATCLLGRDDPAAAAKILESLPASPARDLRLVTAHLILAKPIAPDALRQIVSAQLAPADLPWLHIARGLAALASETPAGLQSAREEFTLAADVCEKNSLRAQSLQVRKLEWLARVKAGPLPNTATLDSLRDALVRNGGTPLAFQYSKLLATALARLGRTAEAVNVLLRAPVATAAERDEANLLTGHILGADKADGRKALFAVLEKNAAADLQSLALANLVSAADTAASAGDTAPANEIYEKLTTYAAAPAARLPDTLHYTRARVMFAAGDYARAGSAANDLLARSPASPFLPDTLRILASGAWQSGSLRRAADYLAQLRNITPPGVAREHLAFVAADSLFLAAQSLTAQHDTAAASAYAAAAAAYADAQTSLASPVQRGNALFLRVRCEVLAGNTAAARKLLDAAHTDGADTLSLLRCEWALAEHLRRPGAGRADHREAAARLAAVFARHKDMPPEFRIRFLWQQALLALVANTPALATAKAGEIEAAVNALPPTAPLAARRSAMLGRVLLLRARAALAAKDSEGARKLFHELRDKHRDEEAAAASYLAEGRALAAEGLHERARRIFLDARAALAANRNPALADYAAEALYEAAAQRVFLGQFPEAAEALENFANEYPTHPLANAAKLRQADIFRRLNRFDDARAVYSRLRERLPDGLDRRRAEMGFADCLFAGAAAGAPPSGTNSALEQAARAYEGLFALPALPNRASNDNLNDMKAEAGYKWADALSRRRPDPAAAGGQTRDAILDDAARACWQVISRLLKDEAAAKRLRASGRYWIARTYDRLSALYIERGMPDDAAQVCRQAIEYCKRNALPHLSVFETTLSKLTTAPR